MNKGEGKTIRLLLEQDDGAVVEVKEINHVPETSDVLIIMCRIRLSAETIKLTQDTLSELTGKRCIILGPEFAKVIGV